MNIIKLFGITFLAFYITTGCTTDSSGLSNPIVKNSIDSICELLKPRRDSKVERVYIDEYYLSEKREQWIYSDSIEKYCTKEEIIQLAKEHKSRAINYIAFTLWLKKDPHEAISYLIEDINNNDTLCAIKLDEGLPESLSSIRVNLVQRNRAKYNVSIEDSIRIDKAVLSAKNRKAIWYYYVLTDPQKDI